MKLNLADIDGKKVEKVRKGIWIQEEMLLKLQNASCCI